MKILLDPSPEQAKKHLERPAVNSKKMRQIVKPIFEKVALSGDKALKKFAKKFDQVHLDSLLVSAEEISSAKGKVSEALQNAMALAKANLEKFHAAQASPELHLEVMPGVTCSRKSVPIQRVGLYIPGGTAPLFSTVLMLGVPAQLAGCQEIVLCSPCNAKGEIHPAILYAASLVGIQKIIKLGGAQAIAAMTFGTASVPKVDKIFGPGNQYVTAAKQLATQFGVAIDMPAGPSEVLVYADEQAIPSFVAADLLSQAEHGVDSQVVLVATSSTFAEKVQEEIEVQLKNLPRKDIANKALSHSCILVIGDRNQALEIINSYAPEHLILAGKHAEKVAPLLSNAGSVFIGNFTPEAAGDYASGTNHTLPTNGFARSYSGVSLDSFVKKITYQKISPKGLQNLGPAVEIMAASEELDGHKRAVSLRLEYIKQKKS